MSDGAWNPAEAATLAERLAGLVEPVAAPPPAAISEAQQLWRSWRTLVAEAEPERWQRRLAQIGRSPDELARLLGPVQPRADVELAWAAPVSRLLTELDHAVPIATSRADGSTVPFIELLAPMVSSASQRLRVRVGERRRLLSERAWQELERQLAWRLARTSEPSLSLEFAVYRSQQRSSIERLLQLASNPNSTALYQEFVGQLREQRLASVVERYPALARCWVQLIEDWIAGAAELLERLEHDAESLAAFLDLDGPLPQVSSLRTDLSDRHHGGRTVSVLRFAGAAELVYKPRNIDVEQRWSELLDWLAARGAPIDLRSLRVLARADHGWVELARAGPCASAAEFPRFYRRAGALLCLVHLLAGNDCHRENLIAVGEHPVLIDVETLMHPATPPEASEDDARARLARELQHSVLGTAMLPHWSPMPTGGGYESGGIGPGGRLSTTIEARVPSRRNTDELTHEARNNIELAATQNVPSADGVHAVAQEHVDALVEGYEAMARFVQDARPALLAPAGPVEAFASVRVRVLMRGTPVYEGVRSRSLLPEATRSGVARSIAMESLVRPLTNPSFPADSEAAGWAMVVEERAALERLDIPRFELRADESAVRWRTGWSWAGIELARWRIARLDEHAIARQSALIRSSFEARDAARDLSPMAGAQASGRAASDAEIRSLAQHICDRVKSLATPGADATATWLAAEVMGDSGAYRLRPMGPSLYSGVTGVGLFLAAAAVVLDDRDARQLALAAVRSTRAMLGESAGRDAPIGGVMGVASTAYGLAWMGRLLEDPSLVDDAVAILRAVDERAIEADRHHDLAGGAAGAILVLLAVHELRPSDDLLARARRCGEHLLASRVGEPAAWPTPAGVRLSGLAHGASGIVLALLRLAEHTPDPRLLAAAREALAFERTLFHPEHGNWQDVRPDVPSGGPSFMNSWCNGAAGIGMVRLHPGTHEHGHEGELAVALQTTSRHAFGTLDHFCCGNVGRAEFLLEAGRRLADEQLIVRSRQLVAAMSERADRRGAWALVRQPHPSAEHAGLFRGLSGIGWHLLRQLAPDRLPALGILQG